MSEGRPQAATPGYRGALPPRTDWMARLWVALVIVIFVAIFVLAALGVPSILFPGPTPLPVPSVTETPSASPGPSGSPAGSPAASPAASPSESAADRISPSPAP